MPPADPPAAPDALGPRPRVSVVIPAYNVSRYIAAAVGSALGQSYPAHEIIVVNDGSVDTPELERALAPFRSRIRYIEQPNAGVSAARNAAIAASEGDLLGFLDGDDVWYPEFLESQVAFLVRGGFDMVYADALLFGDSVEAGKGYMASVRGRGKPTLANLLSLRCHPITSGTLVRKQAVQEVGLFDTSLQRAEDFDLWVRLAHRGARIGNQRRILLEYQIRRDGLSRNVPHRVESELTAFTHFKRTLALDPEAAAIVDHQVRKSRGQLELERGKAALASGDYGAARGHFRVAFEWMPSLKLRLVRIALALIPSQLRRVYSLLRPSPWT